MLLDAGSALGRNCGPLLISKRDDREEEVAAGALSIAIPGQIHHRELPRSAWRFPGAEQDRRCCFPRSSRRCSTGEFDAGLIIHENRFTYEAKGPEEDRRPRRVLGIARPARRSRSAASSSSGRCPTRSRIVNRVLRRSVEYAFAHRTASLTFVRAHAQEMSEDVISRHIDLYVNEYSVDLGAEGRRVRGELLFAKAEATGIIPPAASSLFL